MATWTESTDRGVSSIMVSEELRAGIDAYYLRVERLGGYGARVRAVMPNGAVVVGELIERGFGGCQPGIRTDAGKRYAILDLDSVEDGGASVVDTE